MIDLRTSQKRSLAIYKKRLAAVERGEVWAAVIQGHTLRKRRRMRLLASRPSSLTWRPGMPRGSKGEKRRPADVRANGSLRSSVSNNVEMLENWEARAGG
jgi:hypothetical protein